MFDIYAALAYSALTSQGVVVLVSGEFIEPDCRITTANGTR